MASERQTVLSLLEKSAAYLAAEGFDESRLNAELLLAHVLHLRRLDLYLQFDRPLTNEEVLEFKSAFRRRLTHEPVQYIVGETEFMGLSLLVDRRVFIPRPETELLVEKVLEWILTSGVAHPRVLDVGTGSGNIPVALSHFAPGAAIASVDLSAPALEVAAANIERRGAGAVRLVQGDICSNLFPGEQFDVVVSNPPYISLEEFRSLEPEVRDFEPRMATTDEGDGLKYLRRVILLARDQLTADGALFMEIGFDQSEAVAGLCHSAGLSSVELFKDFAGIKRVVRAGRGQADGATSFG